MFSLEIECDPDDRDLLIAELWEQDSAGIVELEPARACARFSRTPPTRDELRMLFPGSSFRNEEDRDWVQSAHDLLQPMQVGATLLPGAGMA